MSLESDRGRRVVGDPVAIRALAHPLRLKLHELVGREGTITAAQAARRLGVSQALASHHLRQLAKYGFVELAPAGDHRERPWRVTATSFRVEASIAADVLGQLVAQRAVNQLLAWQERSGDADQVWRDNTGVDQSLVYLTADELVEFQRAWHALVDPLVRRRPIGDAAARPPGALPVDLTLICTPLPPTASGG
jgi:DNA-binding transcriptional ArsR family regulator